MNEYDIHLPKAFMAKFPCLSEKKALVYHNKYLNTCRHFLFKALPHIQGDILSFPYEQAFNICGSFQLNNTKYYIWKEFYELQPFFYKLKEGTPWYGISKVKIYDQKYIDLLIDTADTDMLVSAYYSKYETNERFNVVIDYDSLTAYLSRTDQLLKTIDESDNRYGKVLQNYRTAKFFKLISEHFYDSYGEYVIPHIKSDNSRYGRTYYKGINLQNCSKEVRVAALGDHVSYDLDAAAYAIKLMLAKDIYDEFGYDFYGSFTYTKEYLDHKSKIRDELASIIYKHMPNYPQPLKLVKEAMNAIGFGAKMHEGSWEYDGIRRYSALRYIIYNENARLAFAKHTFVKNFLKEQEKLGKIIYEYYSRTPSFVEKVKDIPDIYANNGKLNKSKVLAYLYQHMETKVMDIATENIVPKLRIHDSFIMSDNINSETLKDIKCSLQQISPYLTLNVESHRGWISQNVLDMEQEHKNFIEQEELLANNGSMPIKYIKKPSKVFVQSDRTYYDGYDDGKQYDEYDPERDEIVMDMNKEELQEHYRIIGYNKNKLPDFINKLMGDNK